MWPAERLLEAQFDQLAKVVEHARNTVPFYRDHLADIDTSASPDKLREGWREIPLLSRVEAQGAGPALRTTKLDKRHGKPREVVTSGSTGTPVRLLDTAVTRMFWHALTIREHHWQGRDFSQSLAAIRKIKDDGAAWPDGRTGDNWGASTQVLYKTGPAAVLNIMTPVEQQAEWLQRRNPGYLITFSSNLEALARHCLDRGIALPGLLQARTLAETMRPEIRDVCREAWGVEIADMYSTQEVGYIALQCPEHEHYHVMSERVLVEVIDDRGELCGPGEVGRVVISDLHNFATPVIRYEIGDYAEVGEPCPCGRGLPVLKRILGRTRNMLTLPSGEQVWPVLGDSGYTEIGTIRQLQFIQKTPKRLEIKLVAGSPLEEAEEAALRKLVTGRLGHPFDIALSYVDDIPRNAGGKFEEFMSEIPMNGRNGG